ncbi:hypothetical protein [Sphaerisporangium album]|uniref:hypothetical protein n=1 Tax=Sphaerisporangium album TaxID=509200 RepID=UPI0011C02BF1|nr:hypothetical protein [Sphaerisporangium album]
MDCRAAVCPIGWHADHIAYVRLARGARWWVRHSGPEGVELWEHYAPAVHVLLCERHQVDVFVGADAG